MRSIAKQGLRFFFSTTISEHSLLIYLRLNEVKITNRKLCIQKISTSIHYETLYLISIINKKLIHFNAFKSKRISLPSVKYKFVVFGKSKFYPKALNLSLKYRYFRKKFSEQNKCHCGMTINTKDPFLCIIKVKLFLLLGKKNT